MALDDMLHQGEADPNALHVERRSLRTAVELLENFLLFRGRNTDAAILHVDDVRPVFGSAPHGNWRMRRRILHGVFDQVLHAVAQRHAIGLNPERRRLLAVQPYAFWSDGNIAELDGFAREADQFRAL